MSRVTNVFARLDLEGEGAPRTAVVIQPTRQLKVEVRFGPGCLVARLPGFSLNMPPDLIPVLDGLVRHLEVAEDPDGTRVTVSLEHESDWQTAQSDAWPAETILLFSHAPLQRILGGHTVVIDPAHGGRDAGARGPVNLLEKDVVLDLAQRLAQHLQSAGARTVLTRCDDRALGPRERLAAAERVPASCLIQLHTNHEPGRVRGFRTLFSLRSPGGRRPLPGPDRRHSRDATALRPLRGAWPPRPGGGGPRHTAGPRP